MEKACNECQPWEGADVNLALIAAAGSGHDSCVQALLLVAADVNSMNCEKLYTALTSAAEKGHLACLELLIEGGADVNIPDLNEETPIIRAAWNGHGECLELLIRSGADVNAIDGFDNTPIMCTAWQGHENCMDILIRAGADVNVPDDRENTPLICAAWKGHDKCVELLINSGVDVNASWAHGNTALIEAAANGHLEIVDMLIKAGASVNVRDNDGHTVMMHAAEHGNDRCLQSLLMAGADVNAVDTDENTALTYAVYNNMKSCLNLLLNLGSDVIKKQHYNHALLYAAGAGKFDIVKLLLSAGANVNFNKGTTALIEAAGQSFDDCAAVLLEAGADVNVTDTYGRTALIAAAEADSIGCVHSLLKSGATVNTYNTVGLNALKSHLYNNTFINKDLVMLLYAAGEILDDIQCYPNRGGEVDLPPYLIEIQSFSSLKTMCREVIRNCLMVTNADINLFKTVPKLKCPSPKLQSHLISYLLHYQSIYKDTIVSDGAKEVNKESVKRSETEESTNKKRQVDRKSYDTKSTDSIGHYDKIDDEDSPRKTIDNETTAMKETQNLNDGDTIDRRNIEVRYNGPNPKNQFSNFSELEDAGNVKLSGRTDDCDKKMETENHNEKTNVDNKKYGNDEEKKKGVNEVKKKSNNNIHDEEKEGVEESKRGIFDEINETDNDEESEVEQNEESTEHTKNINTARGHQSTAINAPTMITIKDTHDEETVATKNYEGDKSTEKTYSDWYEKSKECLDSDEGTELKSIPSHLGSKLTFGGLVEVERRFGSGEKANEVSALNKNKPTSELVSPHVLVSKVEMETKHDNNPVPRRKTDATLDRAQWLIRQFAPKDKNPKPGGWSPDKVKQDGVSWDGKDDKLNVFRSGSDRYHNHMNYEKASQQEAYPSENYSGDDEKIRGGGSSANRRRQCKRENNNSNKTIKYISAKDHSNVEIMKLRKTDDSRHDVRDINNEFTDIEKRSWSKKTDSGSRGNEIGRSMGEYHGEIRGLRVQLERKERTSYADKIKGSGTNTVAIQMKIDTDQRKDDRNREKDESNKDVSKNEKRQGTRRVTIATGNVLIMTGGGIMEHSDTHLVIVKMIQRLHKVINMISTARMKIAYGWEGQKCRPAQTKRKKVTQTQ